MTNNAWRMIFSSIVLMVLFISFRINPITSRLWNNVAMVLWAHTPTHLSELENTQTLGNIQTYFERALHKQPDAQFAWRGLGYVLMDKGLDNLAKEAWSNVDNISEEFVRQGEIAHGVGNDEDAIQWYTLAIQMSPKKGDTWVMLGNQYEASEQWEKALEAYQQVIDNDLPLGNSIKKGTVLYRIGRILQWHVTPRPTKEVMEMFHLALANGNFGSMLEEADVHHNLGLIYWWQRPSSMPEQYMPEFKMAITLNPDHVWANILLGRSCFLEQDFVCAQLYLQRAIDLSPDNEWGYLYMGDLLFAEGSIENARFQYDKALEQSPNFAEAQEQLQVLENK